MSNDSIKVKIRKLLEMTAERGCTEAEAAVAMEKAQKLLQEHNLTEVEVLGATDKKDHKEQDDILAFNWAKKVARAVAELYDCRYVEKRSAKRNHFSSTFVGRQSNAETAKLITQFVVKMILKISRQAQKDAGAGNRYATDFQHGCADRLVSKAHDLWREANKEQIEAKEREWAREREERDRLKPNFNSLAPGRYKLEWVGKDYMIKKELYLDEIAAVTSFKSVMQTKPRGVYWLVVQCLEGHLKSQHEYWWVVQPAPADTKRGRCQPQNMEAYLAGNEAGENIGLRIQVGETPKDQLK